MTPKPNPLDLDIYAWLPLVELTTEIPIHLGPVTFCGVHMLGTEPSKTQGCYVIVDKDVAPAERQVLFLDALCLFYFTAMFSRLYETGHAPPFDAFAKFSLDVDHQTEICGTSVHVTRIDPEISHGLGQTLSTVYRTDSTTARSTMAEARSLIRAIRYFVDRFLTRFDNLSCPHGDTHYGCGDAEDIVFLVSSFEALLHLETQHPHIDFKHKLRPMLRIKYGTPVELFWRWVDGFFSLRHDLVQGRPLPDTLFRANANFEVSHTYLGVKFFLYSVYHKLHDIRLVPEHTQRLSGQPLDFRWVHPQELLVYFWPEKTLLSRIWKLMKALRVDPHQSELQGDLRFITTIFVTFVDQYFQGEQGALPGGGKIYPTPFEEISEAIHHVLQILETPQLDGISGHDALDTMIDPKFRMALHQRLHPTTS